MKISDFVEGDLRDYGDYDNTRMIPNIMDGLKTASRKVINSALKLNGAEIKVSVLGSRASGENHYAHGEESIIDVTTGLAKSYPGSNNMPLLEALGQFGTRINNKASSPRYIHTALSDNFKKLFHKDDLRIVEKQFYDGDEIEPKCFIPVLPTILINGSSGVGNGFSSNIFTYSPQAVAGAVKEYVNHGKVITKLVPYLNDWKGTVEKTETGQIQLTGIIKKVNSTTLRITELPPNHQNDSYKAILNKLIDDKLIKDYDNNSTEETWDIVITCSRETANLSLSELQKIFKLVWKMTETFCCWVPGKKSPQLFDGPEAIVETWCELRLPLYQKRKEYILEQLRAEWAWNKLKADFIGWWIEGGSDIKDSTFAAEQVQTVLKVELETANRLLDLKIRSLIASERAILLEHVEGINREIEAVEAVTPIDMMIQASKKF